MILHFITVGCIYAIPLLTLNLLIPHFSRGNQAEQLRHEINSIKSNVDVFNTILIQQPLYEVSKSDSQILFGNPDAQLRITILTNPYCTPCAKMHEKVENLLKDAKENLCIQYIFSSFSEELNYANKYMIAIYLEKGKEETMQLFSEWFTKGKALKELFFENLYLDMINIAIEVELQKHTSWKDKVQLRATPTILVNGYKLPDNYKIEDLLYLIDFNFEIK
jgi:protein-disulfide isomerase